jgi:hypothetical protein
MQPPEPPKITAVEVTAAQPTEADSAAIAHLSAASNRSLPQVVYVVKVRLKSKPPATSMAQFFADHKGQRLRFSQNGVDFHDTGVKVPAPAAPAKSKGKAAKSKRARLPLQADVLK